jgi:hypothetical protein
VRLVFILLTNSSLVTPAAMYSLSSPFLDFVTLHFFSVLPKNQPDDHDGGPFWYGVELRKEPLLLGACRQPKTHGVCWEQRTDLTAGLRLERARLE